MAYLTDGVNSISLDIGWGIIREGELIRSTTRGIGGRQSSFKWADYNVFRVPLSNAPSSDASLINEWWRNTTELTFYLDTTSYASYLTGNTQPFQRLARPYNDEWDGNLIIEMI